MSGEPANPAGFQISGATRCLALVLGALPGLFLLFTSTARLVHGQFVYDVKRLLELCMMLVLFVAAGLIPGLRTAFAAQFGRIPTPLKALLGAIIVIGIISSAVNATSGMHLAYSLLEVALLSMLVLAVLVIAAFRSVAGPLFDQVAITLLALMAIAVGIQELVGVSATLASRLEFHSHVSLGYYAYPRFYNQVQGWTLPVLAALPVVWSHSRSELLRSPWFRALVCLVALALDWYVLLMSGGRGVALGLAISFIACLLAFPAIRSISLRWHLPGLVLGGFLFIFVAQLQERVLGTDLDTRQELARSAGEIEGKTPGLPKEPGERTSRFAAQSLTGRLNLGSSGRWRLWQDSWEDIEAHPVLGIGPMNYACAGEVGRPAHPHNFLLQLAGEWGVPALLGLLMIVGYSLLGLMRTLRDPDSPVPRSLGILLIAGLLAAAAHSLFSGVMVMPASQVAGVLIGGWLMGLIPAKSGERRLNTRRSSTLLAAGILVAVLCTIFSFEESRHREYRESIMPYREHGIPRYWQQGKICGHLDEF